MSELKLYGCVNDGEIIYLYLYSRSLFVLRGIFLRKQSHHSLNDIISVLFWLAFVLSFYCSAFCVCVCVCFVSVFVVFFLLLLSIVCGYEYACFVRAVNVVCGMSCLRVMLHFHWRLCLPFWCVRACKLPNKRIEIFV